MLNIKNRTIFCKDNLDVLQNINSNCIDLIYLDPPFNKNKKFTAPIGSNSEGAGFRDIFREEDVKDEWVESIKQDYDGLYQFLDGVKNISNIVSDRKNKHYLFNYCYLVYMAMRLIEMKRILKDTGSIYLHCDPTMSHYLKILMDIIFGEKNFRNEIVWGYEKPRSATKIFRKNHDILFFYVKNKQEYTFNIQRVPTLKGEFKLRKPFKRPDGTVWKPKEKGKQAGSWWYDIPSFATRMSAKERTGYPTQKPVALLERILKASSNEGDFILDPFCGCATTAIASEKLGRRWVGIDVSRKAYDKLQERVIIELDGKIDFGIDCKKLAKNIDGNFTTTVPKRTDKGANGRIKKHIYVISNPAFKNMYKVGVAKDYKTRLNSYQTSDPKRRYKLEYKMLTPHFTNIEKHIHKIFENLNEWVSAELKQIINEIENKNKELEK